jgi:hypothetical protein
MRRFTFSIEQLPEYKGKGKSKGKAIPVPFLTEHEATKAYWRVEL